MQNRIIHLFLVLLGHLWTFSPVCFYPSFLSFWLSFLMQNPIQTIMPRFCSFLDTDFSLWIPRSSVSIIRTLCSKKWLNEAHRSRFSLRFVLRNSLLGSVISSWKILRFLIKTLKFSQGLRPWTPLTHLVSGFAAHDLRQPKSVLTFRTGPKSAFPSDDPPTPGGYPLRRKETWSRKFSDFSRMSVNITSTQNDGIRSRPTSFL